MPLIYNFKQRFIDKFKAILFERFEYHKITISNQICKENKNEIPNIVYQSWKTRDLPWRLVNDMKRFRRLNKDHSFLIFSDEERDNYMESAWKEHDIYKIYLNSLFQASKTDIWRYCILYERGGFYFDIKSGCNTPLSKLEISKGSVMSYEPFLTFSIPDTNFILQDEQAFHIIQNWSFGFKKNHKLLKMLIENICKYAPYIRGKNFSNPKSAILAFTGPGMLTKTYREYINEDNDTIKLNGINYYSKGLYELEGAKYRFKDSKSYSDFENCIILS